MSKKAFPHIKIEQREPPGSYDKIYCSGMDLIDYFAAHAMQGLMATQYSLGAPCDREVASWSYKVAKEMMEERKK